MIRFRDALPDEFTHLLTLDPKGQLKIGSIVIGVGYNLLHVGMVFFAPCVWGLA